MSCSSFQVGVRAAAGPVRDVFRWLSQAYRKGVLALSPSPQSGPDAGRAVPRSSGVLVSLHTER